MLPTAIVAVAIGLGGCPPDDQLRDLVTGIVDERLGESARTAPSASGACWDANGNGVTDPEEDTNGDGNFNALDCPSEADPNQPSPGGPKIACWDLNGDGVGSPPEDVNGDGNFDELDCEALRGPQGEPGPQGQQGQTGLQGSGGENGIPGPMGDIGAIGEPGPMGAVGNDGAGGATGADGPTGPDGPQGPVGSEGPTGPTGPVGPQGEPGDSHWLRIGVSTHYSAGNVGVGTDDPTHRLDVRGDSIRLSNAAGTPRVILFSDLAGGGGVTVGDDANSQKAMMFVDDNGDGVVAADVKNFKIANPNDPTTQIWYASLEGPEAAAYVRGSAILVDGRAVIALPEHFRAVTVSAGMTVQVTPLSADSLGLAVVEKGPNQIVVRELQRGTGTYEFDYHITAVRRGHEQYKVIRPRLVGPR